MQVDLHNKVIVADQLFHDGVREGLFMHLVTIDTAPLLDQQHQAFALGIRFVQILSQVLERVAHPVCLMQTIVAHNRFGRCHPNREKHHSQ